MGRPMLSQNSQPSSWISVGLTVIQRTRHTNSLFYSSLQLVARHSSAAPPRHCFTQNDLGYPMLSQRSAATHQHRETTVKLLTRPGLIVAPDPAATTPITTALQPAPRLEAGCTTTTFACRWQRSVADAQAPIAFHHGALQGQRWHTPSRKRRCEGHTSVFLFTRPARARWAGRVWRRARSG